MQYMCQNISKNPIWANLDQYNKPILGQKFVNGYKKSIWDILVLWGQITWNIEAPIFLKNKCIIKNPRPKIVRNIGLDFQQAKKLNTKGTLQTVIVEGGGWFTKFGFQSMTPPISDFWKKFLNFPKLSQLFKIRAVFGLFLTSFTAFSTFLIHYSPPPV